MWQEVRKEKTREWACLNRRLCGYFYYFYPLHIDIVDYNDKKKTRTTSYCVSDWYRSIVVFPRYSHINKLSGLSSTRVVLSRSRQESFEFSRAPFKFRLRSAPPYSSTYRIWECRNVFYHNFPVDRWFTSIVNFKFWFHNKHFLRHGMWKDIVVGMVILIIVNRLLRIKSRNHRNYGADISSIRAYRKHRSSKFEQMPDRDGRISQWGG